MAPPSGRWDVQTSMQTSGRPDGRPDVRTSGRPDVWTSRRPESQPSFLPAIFSEPALKCWGVGGNGRLGRGSSKNIGNRMGQMGSNNLPVQVGTGWKVDQVSCGGIRKVLDGAVPHGADENKKKYKKVLNPKH